MLGIFPHWLDSVQPPIPQSDWAYKFIIITSMVLKLNPDTRIGHGSFQFRVDISLAHRIVSYVPGGF